MTDYYPLSIVVHGIALNITVQSHVDQLCFGLIACRRAVPDVHLLGEHLQRAMASLRVLVAPALAAAEAATMKATPTAATPVASAAAKATRTEGADAARVATAAKPVKSSAPGSAKARRSHGGASARAAPSAHAPAAVPTRQPRLRVVAANQHVAPAKNGKPAKSAPAKPRRAARSPRPAESGR